AGMSTKIYEYRIYDANPGKMDALHRRFETATLRIFARYGIKIVGFWTPLVGANDELHYIVEWDSLDEMERTWPRFRADADWVAIRRETDRDGPLVARVRNQLWRAVPYAPQPKASLTDGAAIHEGALSR